MRRLFLLSPCLLLLLCLSAPAQAACPRIVSQSPYVSRVLDWLGLGACIVGVSRYDSRDLPRTGGILDPDAEVIALLEPQLMITSDWTRDEVWQAAAPAGVRALRVGGFRSLAEVDTMLRQIGESAGVADIDTRIAGYRAARQAAAIRVAAHAARLDASERRILIVSACGAVPYSYGRRSTLYELLTEAGFTVVEDHESLRHLKPGAPVTSIARLVQSRQPGRIIALINARSPGCNAQLAAAGVPITAVDDDKFVHPGPGLVEALDILERSLP